MLDHADEGFLVIRKFNPFGYVGFYLTRAEADSVANAPDENGMRLTKFVVAATRHKDPEGKR